MEVIKLLQGFLVSQKVVALELCEINPLLDEKGNRMAECAVEIVNSLFSFP
ncbi:MAG: arginase family protein [Flavobacteriaceae bacterium]